MRTRMLRLTTTACATAMLVGAGALATAGSASAAASAPAAKAGATAATHVPPDLVCIWAPVPTDHPPVLLCAGGGLLSGIVNVIIG